MMPPVRRRLPTPPEDDPLDPVRPESDPLRPDEPASGPVAGPARPATPPRGLRAQIGATRDALLGLARAHVNLARAEADEIKGEVARASALGGLAIGAGI